MNILEKLKFILKRPKVIIITGNGKETAKEAIAQVLDRHFKVGKEILLLDADKKSKYFLKKSRLPILVVTHIGEYHPEKEFFAGELEEAQESTELARTLPSHAYLILNFDDETIRDIKNKGRAHPVTFGFGARADIRATDIVLTRVPNFGTNFKINYEGNIVPCWLEKLFGKENIYAALAAAGVGEVLSLNLVEVSEGLKGYFGIPGKMRLIEGIKDSWILDDSENASSLSMLESLEVLKRIETGGRKIAVLGDILGIGKYTIEAHEAIGEKVKNSADLLFTVGERAKFFAQGAQSKGMLEDKVFQFNNTAEAGRALQEKIREGDLILIDGSKEMSMIDIVEEVKAGPHRLARFRTQGSHPCNTSSNLVEGAN